MHVLDCIPHSLRWLRVANKSIRRTHVDQRLLVLLTERSADKLAEHGQEIGEGTSGTAQLLDVTPRDLDSHVVVAPSIAHMRNAVAAALTRPIITEPIRTGVTVLLPEIIFEQGYSPDSKRQHADVADADQDVIKVVVTLSALREVLQMRIIICGDCCRK